jgi:nitroreductase
MNATEAIYARRAVRDYTPDPIPDSTIRQLIDAAIQAPSAVNGQPWSFVIVQDKTLLKEISDRAGDLVRGPNMPEKLRDAIDDPTWNIFYNANTLIVICARPGGSHPDWDCCLAAQNLLIAARDRGMGGCIIGFAWAALSEPDIKHKLRIPEEFQVVMPVILGYPKHFPQSPGRRSPEILSWKVAAHV